MQRLHPDRRYRPLALALDRLCTPATASVASPFSSRRALGACQVGEILNIDCINFHFATFLTVWRLVVVDLQPVRQQRPGRLADFGRAALCQITPGN